MLKGIAYVNGKYGPLSDASVSVLDLGLVHADATYDVVHVIDGRFFRLDWHLERFANSSRGFRLQPPHSEAEIIAILKQCVRKAKLKNAFVWMICTRGIPRSGIPRDLHGCPNRFIAYAKPYYDILPKGQLHRGVSLLVSSVPRIPRESVDPVLKNFLWADLTKAQFEALDAGFDSAALTDQKGHITEGPGFNIAMISKGALVAPESGALKGITERALFAIAKELGIRAVRKRITKEAFFAADEIFVTSTSSGILPVTRLKMGPRRRTLKAGPVTKALTDAYWQKHTDPKWTTAV